MTDSPRSNALLRVFGIGLCSLVFIAASCEKKPDTAGSSTSAQTTSPPQTTGAAATTKGPDDVGPRAPAVFMLSGLKGYTEPCGCTLDVMLGGIDRIAGYVEAARPLYDSVTLVDGGDLLFETATLEEHEIPQEKAKVDLVMQGLRKAGLAVTVPGERDFALGADYYFKRMQEASVTPIAANLAVDGHTLAATQLVDGRLFVGIVDPAHYGEIPAAKASEPEAALTALRDQIAGADIAILLVHGDLPFAKRMLAATPGADFALVGHGPRETDQVDAAGDGFTLEPYDQGRYLGILKLYNAQGAAGIPFTDARPTSKAELEKVERQIEHVNESINKLPPAAEGEEPAMLTTLRGRLADLQSRREEIMRAAVNVPSDKPAFLWRSIPLEPELKPHPQIEAAREAYNRELRKLNTAVQREVAPVPPGTAEFVGTDNCVACHASAKTFYDGTRHANAWQTLVEREKDFDHKCVGCHSVGYDQPGGSVIGKFEYEATVTLASGERTLHKNLVNVGCESCHGPGSLHIGAPLDSSGTPQHIIRQPGVEQCTQCHVPEHSPRFRFDAYVTRITGEGHTRRP